MLKWKKTVLSLLCLVLLFTMFNGCGLTGSKTVTVMFHGSNVTDDKAVVDAVNKRLAQLGLGDIKFKAEWGTWADFDDKSTLALDTGNRNIDIFFTSGWSDNDYFLYASRGAYLRLDDPDPSLPESQRDLLNRYGQDMMKAIPQVLWDGFVIDTINSRGIYGVPGHKDYAQSYAWMVNNTRLRELGFGDFNDFEWSAETLFDPDFERAMAAAKASYGDTFYPLAIEKEATARRLSNLDADRSPLGLIAFPYDPKDPTQPDKLEVESVLENELYLKVLAKLHEFQVKGFIDPRFSISGESEDLHGAIVWGLTDNYLFATLTYAYGHEKSVSESTGSDIRMPLMSSPIVSTGSAQGAGFAVSAYSKHPVEAVQFLNAWMSDPVLQTLITYGVEGIHYDRNANGTITRTETGVKEYSPWVNGSGNIFLLPSTIVDEPDYYRNFQAFNESGIPTTFLGFNFDTKAVENEIAALINIRAEYEYGISIGVLNPETAVPEYLAKLKSAGFQRVLDEMNVQLKAFYRSR